jgi:hypothetical protein
MRKPEQGVAGVQELQNGEAAESAVTYKTFYLRSCKLSESDT